MQTKLILMTTLLVASSAVGQPTPHSMFLPASNPFATPSALPFQAPPFDKIQDTDYQPAIEAGMAEQLAEMRAIAANPAAPTFDNTFVAMERSGQLLHRAMAAFSAQTGANINPELQRVQSALAPRLAAHADSIHLDPRLFHRIETIYTQRKRLHLDPESLRLVEVTYDDFVHAGARLSDRDKDALKKLNEEASALSNAFSNKLRAATKDGAFVTTDKAALAGLSESQLAAAAQAARDRKLAGYAIPLQNTTQQPLLSTLTHRDTRKAILIASLTRAEKGDANDTRATISRLAQLRAQRARLLGYPTFAAWKLEDQMAKTPESALKFLNALVPKATSKAAVEAKDIQDLINAQNPGHSFKLEPWDWEFYAEQVRKARYDLDEEQLKPFFEIDNVLRNGVFYAATQLYGITFKERHDLPVYHPDVRVFDVLEADGKQLAVFYCDYWKRDNKNGGAWMSSFVTQSHLMGTLPVVYNVANFTKPAPGQPALITYSDATTMFHEFGHALHGMFANSQFPSLSGTSVSRDFVEFPSQFNEHWALYPAILSHYAHDYRTGAAMPAELAAKIRKAATFNQGYSLSELLAASELDMQWHTLAADAPLQEPDAFEAEALRKTGLASSFIPPRYRSSYFSHIWGGGYSAGYYAYQWAEMLDDDAFQWFEDHGGLTRANGDRLRSMVLSRGNTEDLATMYARWFGKQPDIEPMLKYRGLEAGK